MADKTDHPENFAELVGKRRPPLEHWTHGPMELRGTHWTKGAPTLMARLDQPKICNADIDFLSSPSRLLALS